MEYSSALTAILMPAGHNADEFRKVFRIGHLGSFNDLMLMGTLCGVEMGLSLAGVPHRKGGVQAAMDYLATPRAATADATAALGP